MIETSARVISSSKGTVLVEAASRTGCSSCHSQGTCGISGLGKYFSAGRAAISVQCDANVGAGDELSLGMSEGDFLKAGLLAYLLPTVLMITGAGLASSLGFGDAGAVLGAGVGMAAGFVSGRLTGWAPQMSVESKKKFATENTEITEKSW
jgi:sigma-E factor negative regulatory protein RseC